MSEPAHTIFYFYKVWQPLYKKIKEKFPNVEFIHGAPKTVVEFTDIIEKERKNKSKLCIFDDLAAELEDVIESIVSVMSHHYNCSVVVLAQTLFSSKHKSFRVVSLNSHYVVLFKNPRDVSQISTLASQIGQSARFLKHLYQNEMKKSFSYLLMDFHQKQDEERARIRSNIWADEKPMTCYVST